MNEFKERYSCECGNLKGKKYNNEYCDVCHTKVEFRFDDDNENKLTYLKNIIVR